jgi:hypothetical protein
MQHTAAGAEQLYNHPQGLSSTLEGVCFFFQTSTAEQDQIVDSKRVGARRVKHVYGHRQLAAAAKQSDVHLFLATQRKMHFAVGHHKLAINFDNNIAILQLRKCIGPKPELRASALILKTKKITNAKQTSAAQQQELCGAHGFC